MRFQDIPQFTRSPGYMVHVGLDHLALHYTHYVVDYGLDVSPDFQRNYVWTPQQKIRFMEGARELHRAAGGICLGGASKTTRSV